MSHILIADDEKEIIELLSLYLEKDGYKVYDAKDGFEAIDILEKLDIDIAIIDIMMPKMDGYHLIKKIRENYSMPVIMLSAKGDYSDKILGLELGADDYVTKPFNCIEVVARVKAQLRRFNDLNRYKNRNEHIEKSIQSGELKLDINSCSLYKDGKNIVLTSTEYKILVLLMKNIGRVFTKKQIFESIWKEPFYEDDNAIMVHISNLRDKIENDSKKPCYIKTIRGLGYKFKKMKGL